MRSLQNDGQQEAQKAFSVGDAAYSKAVHDQLPANEEHSMYGEYLKTMVFGGVDGIVTIFSIVSSVAGANLKTDVSDGIM